jgi:oleandomycin transport system ATP-binding protein
MDEADQLAHDIVVFDHGRVVATRTPDQLKAKTGGQVLQVAPADPARMAEVTALMTELIRGEVGTDAESSPARTTRPAFSASKVSKTRNWRPPTWTGRPVSSRT